MSLIEHFPVKEEEKEKDPVTERVHTIVGLYATLQVHQGICKFNDTVFWDLWEKGGICPVCQTVVKK